MELEPLCAAVWEAPRYLGRFTRREYTGAFREYTERFGQLYIDAVRETAGGEHAMRELAEGMLDCLERGWRGQRLWNRGAVRAQEKQVIVAYLTPMLVGLEEPLCGRFAEVLRDVWAARWPKDPYYVATYAQMQSGFRSFLGLDRKRRGTGTGEEPPSH